MNTTNIKKARLAKHIAGQYQDDKILRSLAITIKYKT